MAVYTKINKKDISYINRKFDVEEILGSIFSDFCIGK